MASPSRAHLPRPIPGGRPPDGVSSARLGAMARDGCGAGRVDLGESRRAGDPAASARKPLSGVGTRPARRRPRMAGRRGVAPGLPRAPDAPPRPARRPLNDIGACAPRPVFCSLEQAMVLAVGAAGRSVSGTGPGDGGPSSRRGRGGDAAGGVRGLLRGRSQGSTAPRVARPRRARPPLGVQAPTRLPRGLIVSAGPWSKGRRARAGHVTRAAGRAWRQDRRLAPCLCAALSPSGPRTPCLGHVPGHQGRAASRKALLRWARLPCSSRASPACRPIFKSHQAGVGEELAGVVEGDAADLVEDRRCQHLAHAGDRLQAVEIGRSAPARRQVRLQLGDLAVEASLFAPGRRPARTASSSKRSTLPRLAGSGACWRRRPRCTARG